MSFFTMQPKPRYLMPFIGMPVNRIFLDDLNFCKILMDIAIEFAKDNFETDSEEARVDHYKGIAEAVVVQHLGVDMKVDPTEVDRVKLLLKYDEYIGEHLDIDKDTVGLKLSITDDNRVKIMCWNIEASH